MNDSAMSPDLSKASGAAPEPVLHSRYFIHLSLLWIAGTLLGFSIGHARVWAGFSLLMLLLGMLGIVSRRGPVVVRALVGASVLAVAAAWTDVRTQSTGPDDVRPFVASSPRLARFTGIIDDSPHSPPPNHGPFSRFIYRSPSTTFTLRLESMTISSDFRPVPAEKPVTGKLQVTIHEVETRLNPGDRVIVLGFLRAFDPPSNPGEFDYAAYMASQGVAGHVTVEHREQLEVLSLAPLIDSHRLGAWSERFESAGLASLRIGMPDDPELLAFVDALFVGKRGPDLDQLNNSFKRTGLAHILCISGLHFSIFLGLVWYVARLVVDSPRRVSVIVLLFLITYLVMLPVQVAIIRSGIMAGALCLGSVTGRRVRSIDMMALAAVVILIWKPTELFSAGAQLSFIGVTSLLLLTGRIAGILFPPPIRRSPNEPSPGAFLLWRDRVLRFASEYFASSLVPGILTMPVVAYHFALISPPTFLFSLVAGPFVVVVLSLGFVKMLVGILLPSASLILAWPLAWACYGFMAYIKTASSLPGAAFDLAPSPSAGWTVAALLTLFALFAGQFQGRPLARIFCLGVCLAWFIEPDPLARASVFFNPPPVPVVTLRALSVGSGGCDVIWIPAPASDPSAKPKVILFDCGSPSYLDVGSRTIHPALLQLHIHAIDTLILSHAGLDSYSGVIDVMDRHPVGRIIVTPAFIDAARTNPRGPEFVALSAIKAHRIPIQSATATDHLVVNGIQVELLSPPSAPASTQPASTSPARSSWGVKSKPSQYAADASIVLSIRAGGRRILLWGGIQQTAIKAFLDSGLSLAADIADVPRHASVSQNTFDLLRAVHPSFLIDSGSAERFREDPWKEGVEPTTKRLNTSKQGMVELRVHADGKVETSGFRDSP